MTNAEYKELKEAYDNYFTSLYQDIHNPSPPSITMTPLSYLQRIEEDRQNQQYGWGIRKDNDKWEVYEWQRLSELSIHTQGLIAFDEEWQAEQYINNILHG